MANGKLVQGIRLVNDCVGFKKARLTILGQRFKVVRSYLCVVQCECGAVKVVQYGNVANPKSTMYSCGCLQQHNRQTVCRTHGATANQHIEPEFRTWCGMKNRCSQPTAHNYGRYGGRGIRVCERWHASYENFLSDMGKKPTPEHSIDRINPDGNYEPSNCRWATLKEQSVNKRNVARLEFYGKTMSVPEWAEISQVPQSVINHRLRVGYDPKVSVWSPINFGEFTKGWRARSSRMNKANVVVEVK